MLISMNWLRDYVDIPESPEKLAEDLTMLGLNVESLTHRGNPLSELCVGKVLSCDRHPDADKLTVCSVDVGEEESKQIVCGAPNVREGLTVSVILPGRHLPDGSRIKKTKLRGVKSEGMICSSQEMALGLEHEGILEMEAGPAAGTPLSDIFGCEDWILDIDVTPNRPDQLGHLGVAREVAALYERELRIPEREIPEDLLEDSTPFPVEIAAAQACPRYIARTISGVTIAESPEWMRERLQAIGLRPINNVVDITNYVLHETGHPLHAFDRKNLEGDCIKVRFAKKGEKAVTLEEENIQLRPEDLLITDGTSAVALAGVMGCLNSGVSESSEDLVLESACFNASRIRATRKHHDMSTDSSYRFERQADFEMTDFASSRASRLILDIAGGRLSRAVTDLKPEKPEEKVILLRRSRVKTLLGLDLDCGKLANLLLRFQIPSEVEGDDLRVKVPSFRRDLLEEIDLIEEVARLYGYGSLPEENLQSNQMHSSKSKREKLRDRIHRAMTGLSFTELMTSSFMDERSLDQMKLPAEDPRRSLVTLRNPLVSFNEKMRSSLLPGMLDVLKLNVHRDEDQLRLYQLSRVYLAGEEKLPEEPEHLSLLATGLRAPEHWSEKSKAFDSSDLLGITLSLFRSLGVPVSVEYESGESFFAPGQGFRIIGSEGARLGEGGLLRASLLSDLKQKLTIYWMDLSLEKILEEEHSHPAHQEIPSYPPLRRDLALILPESLRWEAVEKVIKEKGGKSLENLYLFDVYSGRGIPEGTRSCAVRLRFRSKDGTLQDEKVDRQIRKILKTLKDTLGVDLRS